MNQGGGGLPKSMTFFFKVETNDGWIVSVQGLLCSTKGSTIVGGCSVRWFVGRHELWLWGFSVTNMFINCWICCWTILRFMLERANCFLGESFQLRHTRYRGWCPGNMCERFFLKLEEKRWILRQLISHQPIMLIWLIWPECPGILYNLYSQGEEHCDPILIWMNSRSIRTAFWK